MTVSAPKRRFVKRNANQRAETAADGIDRHCELRAESRVTSRGKRGIGSLNPSAPRSSPEHSRSFLLVLITSWIWRLKIVDVIRGVVWLRLTRENLQPAV